MPKGENIKSTPNHASNRAIGRSAVSGRFLEVKTKPAGPNVRTESRGVKFPFVPVAKG